MEMNARNWTRVIVIAALLLVAAPMTRDWYVDLHLKRVDSPIEYLFESEGDPYQEVDQMINDPEGYMGFHRIVAWGIAVVIGIGGSVGAWFLIGKILKD
jgi:hypothetical protein